MNRLFLCLWFTLLAVVVGGTEAVAGITDPPVASTSGAPTYYVIMNVANREFLYHNSQDNDRPWTTANIMDGESYTSGVHTRYYAPDNYLWYFVADGNGYKIAPKNPNSASKPYVGYWHLEGFYYYIKDLEADADASIWTIEKFPYSQLGVAIHGDSRAPGEVSSHDYYWTIHTASGWTYISRDTQCQTDPDNHTFVLYSFADLQAEAAAQGLTGTYTYDASNPGASFKTIVNAIIAEKAEANHYNNCGDGYYLLRNRRNGLFLTSNGEAVKGAQAVTNYSVWQLTTVRDTRSLISNAGEGTELRWQANGSDAVWNLSANNPFNATLSAASDGDLRYVSFTPAGATNGYVGQNGDGSPSASSSKGYSSDWQLIAVTKDGTTLTYQEDGVTKTIPTSVSGDSDLLPAGDQQTNGQFYRVQNMARNIVNYSADEPGDGGWLEDVDHLHFQYRIGETMANLYDQEEAQRLYEARTVDFYAALPDMSHASALWEFVLIGKGDNTGESATGIVLPKHNIFALRNANTGKFIGKTLAGELYPTTAADKSGAMKFYLDKQADGQYALKVYKGTSGGSDVSDHVLAIAGTDDGYRAGLESITTTDAPNALWAITPATTLELPLLVRDVKNNDGSDSPYDWTTMYFPFDTTLGTLADGQEVDFFQGGWKGTYTTSSGKKGGAVEMTKVTDVPAGNAVFMRSNKTAGGETYEMVRLNVYPANSGQTVTPQSTFEGNVWKGIIESEESEYWKDNSLWKNYWVLTKNASGILKLLHPANNYLLGNRAYIDAETAVVNSGANVSAFELLIDEADPVVTGVTEYVSDATGTSAVYDITGRKVADSREQMNLATKGIYICNGKKFFVK